MAVVALKSGVITNMDTIPIVQAAAGLAGGNLKCAVGTVAAANGDSIGSTYRMCRLPSNAVIQRVLLSCDAITSGAADIGAYQIPLYGGAVVDADAFASAQSIASALANSDVTHESGVYDINEAETQLWQILGLTADPQRDYDIALTLTAATTAAGDITLRIFYTDNR